MIGLYIGGTVRRVLWNVVLLWLSSFVAGCATATPATPTSWVLASPTTSTVVTGAASAVDTPRPTWTPEPRASPSATVALPPAVAPTAAPSATRTTVPSPVPTPADTPTPTISLIPIGAITTERVGEKLTLEANVVEAASFSKGFQFTLDDGTGQIVLLMWHSVYDDCWDAWKINPGAAVRVTGEVTEYEGRLEIQPRFGGDVKAVEVAPEGPSPRRDIGSISGADEGQDVVIEGRVVRTEGLSTAVKVFVADDSGEILVFIWRNVLDRIADNVGLGTPGSRVRVSGRVQVYRSNLEVVPTLPHDVTVLGIP